jgi:hypothetical protein
MQQHDSTGIALTILENQLRQGYGLSKQGNANSH